MAVNGNVIPSLKSAKLNLIPSEAVIMLRFKLCLSHKVKDAMGSNLMHLQLRFVLQQKYFWLSHSVVNST